MSKCPWPHRLKRIVRPAPAARHFMASSMAPLTACVASGAGTIPSARANCTPAAKHSFWW